MSDDIHTYIFNDIELRKAVDEWVRTEQDKHPVAKKNAAFVGAAAINIIRTSVMLKRVPFKAPSEPETRPIDDVDINDIDEFSELINRPNWD